LLTQDTLNNSKPGPNIQITDPFTTATIMAAQLRAQGAKVIIAITHLGIAQDIQLAKAVKLDLILGGHDHELMLTQSNGTPIYKLGSDARKLGDIEVNISAPDGKIISVNCNAIPVTPNIPEDPRTKAIVDDYEKQLDSKLGVTLSDQLGKTTTDLDALQSTVRASESNVGDYIADAFRQFGNADVGLINGGGLRSDTTYPAGNLSYRDVYSILPFSDKIVVIKVTGAELKKALERSVSKVVEEKQDGAFLQIAGLRFVYSGTRPAGSRVTSVTVNGQPLDDNKEYSVSTTQYVASGSEGYDSFKGKTITTPPGNNDDVKVITTAIQQAGTISPKIDGRITRTN
jgi:5'-nucleotidase